MFGSDFVEGSTDQPQTAIDVPSAPSILDFEAHLVMNEFEDSDDEDESEKTTTQSDPDLSSSMASPSVKTAAAFETPTQENNEVGADDVQRNVRPKLTHPSSPRSNSQALSLAAEPSNNTRLSIIVKDVAYTTYMALLYYVSFDSIR